MKKTICFLCLLLGLVLLAGCARDTPAAGANSAAPEQTPDPAVITDGPPWFVTCRVVAGAGEDSLLLAENGGTAGQVYVFSPDQLDMPVENGALINVYFEAVTETFPNQFSGVSATEVLDSPADDRCGLYLQVLDDLWNRDPGLNTGITELGVDLSGVTDLSGAEKSAVAWRFGQLHGLTAMEGTFEELCTQGYIDRDKLCWEDGCLFSITGTAEDFHAQKWASGDGAYFFLDCTGTQASDGGWSYKTGSEAIS